MGFCHLNLESLEEDSVCVYVGGGMGGVRGKGRLSK